jgi:hypothetical protein
MQDDLFRNVVDEVHLQHEQLTAVFKCAVRGAFEIASLPTPSCLKLTIPGPLLFFPCSEAMSRNRQQQLDQGQDPDAAPAAVAWHGSEAEAAEVMVYHTAILRNKRLLMAYT